MTLTKSALPRIPSIFAGLLVALFLCLSAQETMAQGYKIRAGDTLRVEVLEDPSLNRTVLVAPDGRISMPSAGAMRASGMTVENVQNSLTQRLASNFTSPPNVFVGIERLSERRPSSGRAAAPAKISVYVMGEAGKPGRLDVDPGTTVLQMFAVMGGFTKFAATKRIQLRRHAGKNAKDKVYRLNYNAIEAGSATGRTVLKDGDVIVVPQRRLFE